MIYEAIAGFELLLMYNLFGQQLEKNLDIGRHQISRAKRADSPEIDCPLAMGRYASLELEAQDAKNLLFKSESAMEDSEFFLNR